MRLKSRFLRVTLIVLGVLGFAGYFAFTTFFFSPFEGDLDFDVAALAPRDVDFYVSKARLSKVFDPFPELAAREELEKSPAWSAWAESKEWKELERELNLEKGLADLRAELERIPLGMGALKVFGGRDLAIAGYFKGRELADADWAAYGRANWMGKLAASALRHPGWIGLEEQGIKATVEEEYVALEGARLPRKLYVSRIRDVVVVATKPELVQKAHDLDRKQYADSLHQSANYHDWIQTKERNKDKDEIEVYVNTYKLLESIGFKGEYPDTKSQDFAPALLGRLFQLASMKNVMGIVGHDGGLQADLHGEFSSELITPAQEKLYRLRGFDRAALVNEAAKLAPADAALFVYFHAPIGDLLRQILASMEPALRQTIEDAFRSTGKYQNLEQLVTQLDGALKDRVVLIVRPNDYPAEVDGPPHDDQKVPAIALVLWSKDAKALVDIRQTIGENGSKFGLKGKNETEIGFYRYYEAGYETREYWSRFIPGTGAITTVNAGEITIVTNVSKMMAQILKVQTQGGEKNSAYARLAEDSRFDALVQSALPRSNFLVWANPETLGPILRDRARSAATGSVVVDWASERARERKKYMSEQGMSGTAFEQLSQEEKDKIDDAIQPRIDALQKKFESEQVPTFMAEQERWIRTIEATNGILAMLALDPKSWELTLRAPMPLAKP